jgi:hypothetical protein
MNVLKHGWTDGWFDGWFDGRFAKSIKTNLLFHSCLGEK